MITYNGTLKVSAHEFYATMLEQMAADINQKTGRTMSGKDLEKGCRYKIKTKRGNKIYESLIDIEKPVRDQKISSTYTIDGKTYKMIYEIKPLEEFLTEVTYIQDDGTDKNGFFARRLVESNTKTRFKEFEKYIIKNRNNE